jgi:hypothetical protein
MSAWQTFFTTHRPRIARVVAVAGLLGFVWLVAPAVPRDVDVEVMLGPTHLRCTEVRLAYTQAGEEVHGVLLRFPEGAPERVRHTVQLPEGDFEVRAEAHGEPGIRLHKLGTLRSPNEGVVVIRLPSDDVGQAP